MRSIARELIGALVQQSLVQNKTKPCWAEEVKSSPAEILLRGAPAPPGQHGVFLTLHKHIKDAEREHQIIPNSM